MNFLPLLFSLFLFFASFTHVHAANPSLLLNPTNLSLGLGVQKPLTVTFDSAGASLFGVDAVLTYNPDAIEIVSVQNGTFFTDFSYSNNQNSGKLEIHSYFSQLYDMRAGNGTVATVLVKAKKNNGTSTINFICNNSANSSQIVDGTGKNILPCQEVNQTTVTFSGTAASPTTTGNTAPNCTNVTLSPNSGIAPFTVSVTCTANDNENDIVMAEFDFGDGTKRVIEQNVGRYGSINTSYTYRTPGLYTVICRVKDNNQAYSAIINECTKTATVRGQSNPIVSTSPRTTWSIAPQPSPTLLRLSPYISPTLASVAAFLTPYPTIQTPEQNVFLFQVGKYTLFAIIISLTLIIVRAIFRK